MVDLPTIPQTMVETRRALASADVSLDHVARIIERDPAVATVVLRLANSALYGARSTVSSIRSACVFLGLKRVSDLVLQATVLEMYSPQGSGGGFDPQRLWEHSFEAALAARLLCVAAPERFELAPSDAYTWGLIHDIGKVAMLKGAQHELEQAARASAEQQVPLFRAEEQHLGLTHAHVGAVLARQWDLGTELTLAVMYHHDPGVLPDPHRRRALLLHAANSIAHDTEPGVPVWARAQTPMAQLGELGLAAEQIDAVRAEVAAEAAPW